MSLTRQLRRSSQTLLLVMAPHGGQATARRNAWAGMTGAAPAVDRATSPAATPASAATVPQQKTYAGTRPRA